MRVFCIVCITCIRFRSCLPLMAPLYAALCCLWRSACKEACKQPTRKSDILLNCGKKKLKKKKLLALVLLLFVRETHVRAQVTAR